MIVISEVFFKSVVLTQECASYIALYKDVSTDRLSAGSGLAL